MKYTFIFLFISLISCSSLNEELENEDISIIPYIKEGMNVYEPLLGNGNIFYISPNNSFIKVQFSGLSVMIFNKFGKCKIGNEELRIQPNKNTYNWN